MIIREQKLYGGTHSICRSVGRFSFKTPHQRGASIYRGNTRSILGSFDYTILFRNGVIGGGEREYRNLCTCTPFIWGVPSRDTVPAKPFPAKYPCSRQYICHQQILSTVYCHQHHNQAHSWHILFRKAASPWDFGLQQGLFLRVVVKLFRDTQINKNNPIQWQINRTVTSTQPWSRRPPQRRRPIKGPSVRAATTTSEL